jgi:signal transduction histidine kinase
MLTEPDPRSVADVRALQEKGYRLKFLYFWGHGQAPSRTPPRNGDDAGGLAPAPERLTDLINRFAVHGPAVRLHLPDGPPDPTWPPEVTTTIYRVVAEALINIKRHASGARHVTVTLTHDQRTVTVEITDDAPPAGSPWLHHCDGYGLIGMRERVEASGGTLIAGPQPDAGWSVRATLPTPDRP